MKPLYKIILEPKGERYNNRTESGLILNSVIDASDFSYTNRIGVVKATPVKETIVKEGDEVIVHTNVFRKFWNLNKKLTNGGSYIDEGVYACYEDQVFAYKREDEWVAIGDYCFVKPIDQDSNDGFKYDFNKYEDHVGEVVIDNEQLNKNGIYVGDKIGFLSHSEFKFKIDGEIWYKMESIDIAYKYEG